jgi:ABC-type Fe3+/spermidine/putrescine transport system ATPase subunit
VTHDQEEAMALADRVAVMNQGRVEQFGTPEELEAGPASPFVFEFLGEVNRGPCVVSDGMVRFDGFSAPDIGPPNRVGVGEGLFRPSDTHLAAGPGAEGLPVRLIGIAGRGAIRRIDCQAVSGLVFAAEMPEHLCGALAVGERARLTVRRAMGDIAKAAATQAVTPAPLRETA